MAQTLYNVKSNLFNRCSKADILIQLSNLPKSDEHITYTTHIKIFFFVSHFGKIKLYSASEQ